MRKYINKIKIRKRLGLLFLAGALLGSTNTWADGSKDLYPSGKAGIRAYLRSGTGVNANYPFANNGVHYVYARAGESIGLASSAQGSGSARIYLYAPDGTAVVNGSTAGNIPNRTAELAGPKLPNGTGAANTYTPVYYTVPAGKDGIYRVEFTARDNSTSSTTLAANTNWTQSSNEAIMAWEISVASGSAFVKGRVYTTVLNLNNGNVSPNTQGFEGIFYVLTKDGYTYKVNNNGNNGMYFTFMVNNNGFLDTNGDPIYKSLNTTSNLGNQVHDPNNADTSKQITHKMFYTLPASDLPASASGGPTNGGSTWLKNAVVTPDVTGVQLKGVEGTPGQVSNKGGFVEFVAATQGNYTIVIESTSTPSTFVTRQLRGAASAGLNRIPWDGKDGAGNLLPPGTVPAKLTVQLQGAEVHFPFFDMEYNTKGLILELLDHNNLNTVVSDIVYWNDTGVSLATSPSSGTEAFRRRSDPLNNSHLPPALGGTNSMGISSAVNGHIWGQGATGTSGQFGDNKSIDTWTFIKGEAVTIITDVAIKIADLEVVSITPDKSEVRKNNELSYTVKVKNNGPSDVTGSTFTFKVPEGFDPVDVVFTGNGCGTESVVMVYDPVTRTYTSKLDLPNGCEITYEIKVKVTNPAEGNVEVEATILRPNDVYDPDATNPDQSVPPTDAHYECDNNGLSAPCNNIKSNNGVVFKAISSLITNPMVRQLMKK